MKGYSSPVVRSKVEGLWQTLQCSGTERGAYQSPGTEHLP